MSYIFIVAFRISFEVCQCYYRCYYSNSLLILFLFFKYNLLSSWLTYSVYSVLLVLGVDSRDSSLTYNTQCSSQQVPSSMPITHFPSPLHPPPPQLTLSLFFVFKRPYGLPPSLSVCNCFSPSLPPWSSVKFLKIYI